jgi:hypothetical protein
MSVVASGLGVAEWEQSAAPAVGAKVQGGEDDAIGSNRVMKNPLPG